MRRSAGILLFRRRAGLEVFLVHPGGPFWAQKDLGAWSIPKGEYTGEEAAIDAARREFGEETGFAVDGEFLELGYVMQKGGKHVTAWGVEGDCDAELMKSNTCEIEWPPRSGKQIEIPEVDRGKWFGIVEAKDFIFERQQPFLGRLVALLRS